MLSETRAPTSNFVKPASTSPHLTHLEELELARRWRDADDAPSAERLVRGNLRYVMAIALQYRRYGIPLDELVAEGNFGLVHALGKFDPERGLRFITYAAFWIRAYVLNYVIRSRTLVGPGTGAMRSKVYFKLRRERARIFSLAGEGEHADDLLAKAMNMTRAQVQSAMHRLDSREVSLDVSVFGDSAASGVDKLMSSERDPEHSLASTQVHERTSYVVRCALDALDHRERYIAENRFMAEEEDRHSLAEIGRYFGVSRERARQLETRAKRRLLARISKARDVAVTDG